MAHLSDAKDKPFTAHDIRFTIKDKEVYALTMDVPPTDLMIANLGLEKSVKIKSIDLIGNNIKIICVQTSHGTIIKPLIAYPTN